MPKVFLIITILIFGLTFISDIVARIYIYRGKKMTLSTDSYSALMKILNLKQDDLATEQTDLEIIEAKNYYYHPLKNIIAINDFTSTTVHAHLATLHEAGHYLSINSSEKSKQRFRFSTVVIAFNRLIVIPFFVLSAFLLDYEKGPSTLLFSIATIFLIYFVYATILRFYFGLAEEQRASRIGLNYIEKNDDQEVFKFARVSYRLFYLQYFFFTLLIAMAIPFIYWVIFFFYVNL